MSTPLDNDLLPPEPEAPLNLSVLLGWALVATLGIVLRAQGVSYADGMLVTGFAGYSGYALFALARFDHLPVPRWTLCAPSLVFLGMLLWFANERDWQASALIWFGGAVVLTGITFVIHLLLGRQN